MRVLFVTDCYPTPNRPQYCVFLEQQAIALKQKGVLVDVYYFSHDSSIGDTDYCFNGIDIYMRAIRRKISKIDIILPRRLSVEDEKEFFSIVSTGYDIVSFHFGNLACLLSVQVICKKIGIPLVHHFHGLNIWGDFFDSHPILTSYRNVILKRIYNGLSCAVCVSNKVGSYFTARIKEVPTFTVYNGVDVDRFYAEKYTGSIDIEKVEILCVGNLIPIKGQMYLIEAIEQLNLKGVETKLIFAGSGPDENKLRKECHTRRIDATFLGYLQYDEICELMIEKSLFVLPSFFEALGCVYLEAMAAGMITVGVREQGIEEIIVDGVNGFLVEPRSVDSLVEVLLGITKMNNEQLCRISENARKTSLNYTWDKSAERLINVYQFILKEKR